MKTILMILSKTNLFHKAISPGIVPIIITKHCSCNGTCNCKK